MSYKLALLAIVASTSLAQAQDVKLARSYVGSGFVDGFDFYTDNDPTNGYVNYVSSSVATSSNLVKTNTSYFTMAVDSDTASASGRGRNSVRIVSKDSFADGVYVLDVDHIPVGCGTWPAFWTTTRSGWPKGGEIDVIEGYNSIPPVNSTAFESTFAAANLQTLPVQLNDTSNTASLHTVSTCALRDQGIQTGTTESPTCDASVNGNQGCGIDLGNSTGGNGWNANGGGYYVLWRDTQKSGSIKVYTFPRSSSSIPADLLLANASTLSPRSWTVTPNANFSIPQCANSTFNSHAVVLNTALCGDLAGNTWSTSGCQVAATTCNLFVKENAGAFKDAFWGIRSLKIYTADGNTAIVETSGASSLMLASRTWAVAFVSFALLGSLTLL